jgi:hypothetical protein
MDDWRMVIELLQQFVNRKPENFRTINEIAKQILLAPRKSMDAYSIPSLIDACELLRQAQRETEFSDVSDSLQGSLNYLHSQLAAACDRKLAEIVEACELGVLSHG